MPWLGDIPVLGGLFYRARRVPGSSVELPSNFGFTEQASVDGGWQHSMSLMIILQATIVRDPFSSD